MRADSLMAIGGQRRPWVTYGLVVACLVSLSYVRTLESDARSASDAALGSAVAYLESHPQLSVPAVLEGMAIGESASRSHAEREQERIRRGAPPIPRSVLRRQQEALDDLIAEGLEPLLALPAYQFGVRPGHRSSSAYVTHPFVHAGWLHLLGGGLVLLCLGFFLERAWGKATFGSFVLLAAFASATAFASMSDGRGDPLIGTSGIVAAAVAAFAVRFAGCWRDPSYLTLVVVAIVWLVAPMWTGWDPSVATDFALGDASADFASRWAVAGGAGFGVFAAALIATAKIEETFINPSPEGLREQLVTPELEQALEAHASGHVQEAFDVLAELVEREPDNRNALLAMWDVAIDLGRPANATRALLQVIRGSVRSGASEQAVEHWLELTSRGLEAEAEPPLLIRMALLLHEQDHPRAALDALRRALDQAGEADDGVVAARVARASRNIDKQFAEDAAWRALGSVDLGIEERQSLEALLAQLQPDLSAAAERFARAGKPTGRVLDEPRAPRAEAAPTHWEDAELGDETGAAPAPAAGLATEEGARRVPIDLDFTSRTLKRIEAVPTTLDSEGIVIEPEQGGARKRVPYEKVEAVCVVAIEGVADRPVIVVDLILNWSSGTGEPLKVIRLRGDRFDPRRITQREAPPLDAMRAFVERLLEKTGATPLPDRRSAIGRPFASFDDVESYERSVLSVEPPEELEIGDDEGPVTEPGQGRIE